MERTDKNVDDYLAGLTGERADSMRALDAVIAEELPGLERVLWEGVFWGGTEQQIIGYGGTATPRPRGEVVEWFLIGLADQKKHISLYVNANSEGKHLVQLWKDRLGKVNVGTAAATLTSFEGVDVDGLRGMIREARRLTPEVT
ncbi:hypothetical protein ABIE21_001934 [Conyzicola nivalis]|uniref:YdhG-like domain-containing protein n=1 Tax=Conyzicola nivalis TaxID=1477021 RepID=A0ABV2QMZ5_9MICO